MCAKQSAVESLLRITAFNIQLNLVKRVFCREIIKVLFYYHANLMNALFLFTIES